MAQIFFNNARGTLKSGVTTFTDTLLIENWENFPSSLPSGDWFLATLFRDSRQYGENLEVVRVKSITPGAEGSLVLSVDRGYEGPAFEHALGERIEVRITAGTMARAEKTRKTISLMQLGINLL